MKKNKVDLNYIINLIVGNPKMKVALKIKKIRKCFLCNKPKIKDNLNYCKIHAKEEKEYLDNLQGDPEGYGGSDF
jgi:hypothetical protein